MISASGKDDGRASAGWVRSCANYGDLLDNRRAPKALQTDKLVQATLDARPC
jgi:hypothetical protein